MEHSRVTIVLSVIAGMVIGFLLGISYVPAVTVTEFEPTSIRAPGPDLVQPGGEQAVVIPASMAYYDGHKWVVTQENIGIPARGAAAHKEYGVFEGWCSDGVMWPARSDGSCWMADKPK